MARYFIPQHPLPAVNAKDELLASLGRINTFNPPVQTCSTGWRFSGFYSGPTSISYLFLRLSQLYPDLTFKSQSLSDWAHAYIDVGAVYLDTTKGGRPLVDPSHCGIANEHLCQLAIRSVLLEDASLAQRFCSHSSTINDADAADPALTGSDEWLYGRSGYLYLLRLLRGTFSASSQTSIQALLTCTINATITRILATPQPWRWHSKAYLGAVHGSMGIITQILLSSTTPEQHATALEPLLRDLLAQQTSKGNFPTTAPTTTTSSSSSSRSTSLNKLVQFCHGAPGCIISLRSIKAFFPQLAKEIDRAIEKAQRCVQIRGLLTKAPCLCHGIAGNALALLDDDDDDNDNNDNDRFEEWLRCMSSSALEDNKEWMAEAGRTDDFVGLWTGEAGRAWTWAVAVADVASRTRSSGSSFKMKMGVIGYNDL